MSEIKNGGSGTQAGIPKCNELGFKRASNQHYCICHVNSVAMGKTERVYMI